MLEDHKRPPKREKHDTSNNGILKQSRVKEIAESAEKRKEKLKSNRIKQLMKPEVREKALMNAAKARFFKVKVLNEKQLKAVTLMSDFMNDWSPEYICGQCSINLATLYNWRNDPFFIKALDKEITRRQTMFRLEAHRKLFKQIKKGNPRLLLAYLKMTGDMKERVEVTDGDNKKDLDSMNESQLDAEIQRLSDELGISRD
jgi:hypothetical protein